MNLDHWDDNELEYAALRARNLADEMIVGWSDCTELSGFDLTLTAEAELGYAKLIESGKAESNYDEVCRSLIFQHLDDEAGAMRGHYAADKKHMLGWADTQLASRALKALSEALQDRFDNLPPPAAEAA